jgi:DNA phosphorothioation-associated putative methyltransferase
MRLGSDMDLAEYRKLVESVTFGKRLPGAVYVLRTGSASLGQTLDALVAAWLQRFAISEEFNVIKFRTDELKISFLSYPAFFTDAHPALRHSITIDLVTGRARRMDYAENSNPPILHRKESFIPFDHPRHAEFETLTKQEEEAGLYEDTTTIGFKLNWERLLQSKGLVVTGHKLEGAQQSGPAINGSAAVVVERHKTALTRYELSKPVKACWRYTRINLQEYKEYTGVQL